MNEITRFFHNAGPGLLALIYIPILIVVVLSVIAWCFLFRKAGKHPGFFFIPVYGQYCQYDVADSAGLFFVLLATSILGSVISWFLVLAASPQGLIVLAIAMGVVSLVVNIIFSIRLAQAFGKGGGFAVGLIFLPVVFLCILAFGKAEHYTTLRRRAMEQAIAGREQERALNPQVKDKEAPAALPLPAEADRDGEQKPEKANKGKKKDKDKKGKDKKKSKKSGKKKDKKKDQKKGKKKKHKKDKE